MKPWNTCELIVRERVKKKNYLVGVFYERRPENIEKLKWIQKLNTILTKVTKTWNKTIIIAGDTIIDFNKSSIVFGKYKEVIDTYNLKQHITKPTRRDAKIIDHIIRMLYLF